VNEAPPPAPDSGVSAALRDLESGTRAILSGQLTGMYLSGSLVGPEPRSRLDPLAPLVEMRRASLAIPETWQAGAQDDPSWLDWLRDRQAQVFVALTLCRLLYTFETGGVASKPGAALWAQKALGQPWSALIERSLAAQHEQGRALESEVGDTVALVHYTAERGRQAVGVRPCNLG